MIVMEEYSERAPNKQNFLKNVIAKSYTNFPQKLNIGSSLINLWVEITMTYYV